MLAGYAGSCATSFPETLSKTLQQVSYSMEGTGTSARGVWEGDVRMNRGVRGRDKAEEGEAEGNFLGFACGDHRAVKGTSF